MGELIFRIVAATMLGFLLVHAPITTAEGATTPADKVPVTVPVDYFSAFSDYVYFQDQPVLSWREANDQAGMIGGWRFYVREGKQSASDGAALESGTGDTKKTVRPSVNSDLHHEHGSKP